MKLTLRMKKAAEPEDAEPAPDIKLTFGYTYDDYMEANRWHWAGRRQAYAFVSALLFGLSLLYVYFRPHQGRGYIAGVLSLIFLLLMTKYFQQYLDFAWRLNKTYRQPFDAQVTGQNILITGSSVKTTVEWGLVDRFTETDNLFLLYQRSRSFVIFPKRAFLADDEVGVTGMNQFRTFVASKAQAGMRRVAA